MENQVVKTILLEEILMKNFYDSEEMSRMLQSLILLCQDSAERGQMDSSVYADVLLLISDMTTELMQIIHDEKAGVTA